MKRTVYFILAFIFCLIFSACGRRLPEPKSTIGQSAAPSQSAVPVHSDIIATSEVMFFDDFQDGNTDGWQISANWDVQQEGDVYTFNNTGKGSAFVPGGMGWNSGYALRANYQLSRGNIVFSFNSSDQGRYFINISADSVYLRKEDASGNKTTLANAIAPPDGQHYIVIAEKEGAIQVYIDKELWLAYEDAAPLDTGTIMLGATDGSEVWVDNVLVSKIPGKLRNPNTTAPTAEPVKTSEPEDEDIGLDINDLPDEAEEEPDIPENNVPDELPQPRVIQYSISSNDSGIQIYVSIDAGEEVTVKWSVEDASCIYLNDEVVDMKGEHKFTPQQTTEYTLGIAAFDGTYQERTVTAGIIEPELYGTDLTFSSVSVARQGNTRTVDVRITVKNIGDVTSGAFVARWYAHTNAEITFSWEAGPLAPGQTRTFSDVYNYVQRGTMHWRAEVDEENEVSEHTDGNNTVNGTVEITE